MNKRSEIPDVAVVVDRRAACVDSEWATGLGRKFLNLPAQSVVETKCHADFDCTLESKARLTAEGQYCVPAVTMG